MTPSEQQLIEAIKELRAHTQQSQEQFAATIGVTLRTVARWEARTPPRGIVLLRLADAAAAAERGDLQLVFQQAEEAELALRSGPHALAIRQLRSALGGISQQELAQRSGLSLSTISKAETSKTPEPGVLAKLAHAAREAGLEVLANEFTSAFPRLSFTAKQRREKNALQAFLEFARHPDPDRLDVIESLLLIDRETDSISVSLPEVAAEAEKFRPRRRPSAKWIRYVRSSFVKLLNELELQQLAACAWLLAIPGTHRHDLRRALVEGIARAVSERRSEIPDTEIELLGDIGADATKLAASRSTGGQESGVIVRDPTETAFRELTQRLSELTLPVAIETFRRQLAMSQSVMADRLGIPTKALKQFEAGTAIPDHQVLASLTDLAPPKFHQDATIEYFSVEALFISHASENAAIDWLERMRKEATTPAAKGDLLRKVILIPQLSATDRGLVEATLDTIDRLSAMATRLRSTLAENRALKERLQIYEPLGFYHEVDKPAELPPYEHSDRLH